SDGRCADRAASRHAGGSRRGSGARPTIAARRRLARVDRHRAGGVLRLYVRPVFCHGDVRDRTGAHGIKSRRTFNHRWRARHRGCGLVACHSTSSLDRGADGWHAGATTVAPGSERVCYSRYVEYVKSCAFWGTWQLKHCFTVSVAIGFLTSPPAHAWNPQPPVDAYFFESLTIRVMALRAAPSR